MNCNAHCRECGGHFSSTSAFDRHREGPWDDRRCGDPEDHARLYSYTGDCDIAGAEDKKGITVWSTKKDDS